MLRYLDMTEEAATYAAGVFTLGGALAGRQAFGAGLGDGDRLWVRARNEAGDQWEILLADYEAGALTRADTVASSSDGDPVAFSGTVAVACVRPAASGVAVGWSGEAPAAAPGGVAAGPSAEAVEMAAAFGHGARATHEASIALGAYAQAWGRSVAAIGNGSFIWSDRTYTDAGSPSTAVSLDLPGAGCLTGDLHVLAREIGGHRAWAARASIVARRTDQLTVELLGSAALTVVATTPDTPVSATLTDGPDGLSLQCDGTSDAQWRWTVVLVGAADLEDAMPV